MAAPTTPGLTPNEVAFLAEHELVDVMPRQRLERIELLAGPTPSLVPPHRASIPLWLALLLKRQQRANILPPPWLSVDALTKILDLETELPTFTRSPPISTSSPLDPPISPPFIPSSTSTYNPHVRSHRAYGSADKDDYDDDVRNEMTTAAPIEVSLPYHWLEISQLLLDSAPDDIPDSDAVRRLLRDLRECRAAKMRGVLVGKLEGARELRINGIAGMEVAEHRSFVTGVVDGLRKIGASKETSRREREEEEDGERAVAGGRQDDEDSDDDMGV